MDMKNLVFGSFFIIAALFCVFTWVTRGFASYLGSGVVLFTLIGIAFLRRARPR